MNPHSYHNVGVAQHREYEMRYGRIWATAHAGGNATAPARRGLPAGRLLSLVLRLFA